MSVDVSEMDVERGEGRARAGYRLFGGQDDMCAAEKGSGTGYANAAIWKEWREREQKGERGGKIMGKRRIPGEQERLRTDKDVMGSTAAPRWAEPGRRHTRTHTPLSINLSSET